MASLILTWGQAIASNVPCTPLRQVGSAVDIAGVGRLRLMSVDQADSIAQSIVVYSYAFVEGARGGAEESQLRKALERLFDDLTHTCRHYPLTGARIFIYPDPTVGGGAYLARLNTKGMKPEVDLSGAVKRVQTNAQVCDPSKDSRMSSPYGTKLPPMNKRRVLGSWSDSNPRLVVNLDEVAGRVYLVRRTRFCSSGEYGHPLKKGAGPTYHETISEEGEYYKIEPDGQLGSYDRKGVIEKLPRHPSPFADQ
jgi:hypothetical protein